MVRPNITDTIIATGYNCFVEVQVDESSAPEVIAMVTSFQATEDYQVQDAICIGNLGPISIDPQGYNCSITLDGFLPARRILDGNGLPETYGGGTKAVQDFAPSRDSFMSGNGIPQKIHTLRFKNRRDDNVALASFEGVIVTSNGVSGEGNSYVRNNMQLRALSWNKD
jgi:hypothetical protein